jgi:hypothetical protein
MTLTTFANPNITNDPVTFAAIDTGLGSAPANRAAVFTPQTGYPTIAVAQDSGVNSTVATRPTCFEPPSCVATIDPGLGASG